jgi:SAM-dependent methyltransferase
VTDSFAEVDRWGARRNRLLGFIRDNGLSGLALEIRKRGAAGIVAYLHAQCRYTFCKVIGQRWDDTFGVDTGGQIELDRLDVAGSNRALGAPAVSTSPKTFNFLSQLFPEKRAGVTYVDIGAGKGRTLILASQLGFTDIIGVEFSDALCAKARDNIASFRAKTGAYQSFQVIHADATEYVLPPGHLVLYFGNPFALELWPEMIKNILRGVRQESNRNIILMVAGSQQATIRGAGSLLSRCDQFVHLASGKVPYFLDTYLPYFFECFAVRASDMASEAIADGAIE